MVVLLMPLFIFSQEAASENTGDNPRIPEPRSKTVGVMPFMQVDYSGSIISNIESPLSCPLSGLCVDINKPVNLTETRLTRYLQDALRPRLRENLIPLAEVEDSFKKINASNNDTPLAIAARLGKALNADYIVVGILWEFTERVGKSRSVESPAAVSFTLFLVDIAKETQAWKRHYQKQQRPLTDNILEARDFFKGGRKWQTADELAKQGMQKILADFPL